MQAPVFKIGGSKIREITKQRAKLAKGDESKGFGEEISRVLVTSNPTENNDTVKIKITENRLF